MQRERRGAGDHGGTRGFLGGSHRRVEDRGAGAQRATERVLLGVGDVLDGLPVRVELGVRQGHDVLGRGEQGRQRRVLDAEKTHGAHRAANQPPQHVAASVVSGTNPIADEHQGGTDMVRNDAHAHVIVVGAPGVGAGRAQPVGLSGHLLRGLDDGEHLVDLVHVRLVLHDEGEALQAGPRVDRGLVESADEFEVVAFPLSSDELIENEVPDLEETIARDVDDRATIRAVRRTAVVVDFAARAGGPRLPRRPGDLLKGQTLNALGVDADRLRPVIEGHLVLLPDRHPQPISVEAVPPSGLGRRQKLPGVVDRAFLEVVAEGEVAVHLEEGAVARRLANVVDVVGTDALLNGGGARPRGGLGAQDVRDERNHSRDGKENGGLGRNERYGGGHVVALGREVVEPAGTDFRRAHSPPC